MDVTLILLVVVLIVVVVVFTLALRAGGRREDAQASDQRQGQQQAPERPAIAAPRGQSAPGPQGNAAQRAQSQDGADQDAQGQGDDAQGIQSQDQGQPRRQSADAPDAEPKQVTTTTTTTREIVSPAPVQAETALPRAEAPRAPGSPSVSGAPDASDTVAASGQGTRETAPADDRVIVRGARVVDMDRAIATDPIPANMAGAAAGERGASAGSVRYTGDAPPATVVTASAPHAETSPVDASSPDGVTGSRTTASVADATAEATAAPVQTRTVSDGATSTPGAPASMELVGQPLTRSGEVMLSVAPQRLPFRVAELLGEQRGLEEAITIARRRLDDIELGPDPGSTESRVRLGVLREDLAQKQERLREILFLQDGYRWLQQHMAPERAPSES